jgi:hypothetical protein
MVCVKEYTKTYEEMLNCGWLERFGYREITLAKTNAIFPCYTISLSTRYKFLCLVDKLQHSRFMYTRQRLEETGHSRIVTMANRMMI